MLVEIKQLQTTDVRPMLARRYLAIQATSSPSKKLFSKAGQVSTSANAQVKPEKVDQLVFLADNL